MVASGSPRARNGGTSQEYKMNVKNGIVNARDLSKIQRTTEDDASSQPKSSTSIRIYDPGFKHTAIMKSSITMAYGEQGKLIYRGHNMADLVYQRDFEDVGYLLIWGHFPSPIEKFNLQRQMTQAIQDVPKAVKAVVRSFPRSAPHMTILVGALSAALGSVAINMPASRGQNLYLNNMPATDAAIIRVLSIYNACIGLVYNYKAGTSPPPCYTSYTQPPSIPSPQFPTYVYSVFNNMSLTAPTGPLTLAHVSILQRFWISSADHKLAHSTSALLHAASALADPLSCVISAMTAGYGILHLGAIEASYRFLQRIGTPKNVAAALKRERRADSRDQRLMGIGHRVYKVQDPRVAIIKDALRELRALGAEDPLQQVSEEIERQVASDEWFRSRRLCVNPDLYWMFLYTSVGIPIEAVVPIFFAGRMMGMMAHWREAMTQGMQLWRPNQIYVGKAEAGSHVQVASKL